MKSYSRKKSPWIIHFSCSGCNGCTIEELASLTPRFDIERFGAQFRGSPRHADILLVDGVVNKKVSKRLKRIYNQMAKPRVVMAVGACATGLGVFRGNYGLEGPLDKVLPVDVFVSGCPPRPESIIDGLLKAIKILGEKD
ncbi:MAG: NADH-quinone oxidoreductase subunit NuoB [Candidatus Aenigmarchaeota archaeon]|nr:NADH-quinone oxidoreductase subunit NuoB [Candidatus Aenigmarchaeota archaeon]